MLDVCLFIIIRDGRNMFGRLSLVLSLPSQHHTRIWSAPVSYLSVHSERTVLKIWYSRRENDCAIWTKDLWIMDSNVALHILEMMIIIIILFFHVHVVPDTNHITSFGSHIVVFSPFHFFFFTGHFFVVFSLSSLRFSPLHSLLCITECVWRWLNEIRVIIFQITVQLVFIIIIHYTS